MPASFAAAKNAFRAATAGLRPSIVFMMAESALRCLLRFLSGNRFNSMSAASVRVRTFLGVNGHRGEALVAHPDQRDDVRSVPVLHAPVGIRRDQRMAYRA